MHCEEVFFKRDLFFADRWDTTKLTMLVCRLYYMSLWLLPAFVRQWWKSMDSKEATVVDKLTTRFVSPTLIMEEMKAIKRENNIEKFSVRFNCLVFLQTVKFSLLT